MTHDAELWIDILLKRAPELRRAGVLSVGCGDFSAVLAAAEPASDSKDDDAPPASGESTEPANHWEHPGSYPTGNVPKLDVETDLPEIPKFGDG